MATESTGRADTRGAWSAGPAGSAARRDAAEPAVERLDRLPPFRLVLHRDDAAEMTDVVDALVELTPLARDRAVQVMLEAHRSGSAGVLVTHRERAELYVDQFASASLRGTIEPA